MKSKKIFLALLLICLVSCGKKENVDLGQNDVGSVDEIESINNIEDEIIDVNFKLGQDVVSDENIAEDAAVLKNIGRTHSVKYYSYKPSPESTIGDFIYYDVSGNKRVTTLNENIPKNEYKWESDEGVLSKKAPIGHKMTYGIDISKHNKEIDFEKVKAAGFDFVFIRIVYRGYGKRGSLNVDEMQEENLKRAKEAGLKIGAYVFSQSLNEQEAVEEAQFAIATLKDFKLDLPLCYDAETIRSDIARTDNVTGEQWTKNAIAFCEEIKKAGFTPAIYSNMVWEDYYFNLESLKNYDIWYSDYNKLPQTPYHFKYWQFSEVGIVDGIEGSVDLNVMID